MIAALAALDHQGKREVLAFTRELVRRQPATGPGGALLVFAGTFADACEIVDQATW